MALNSLTLSYWVEAGRRIPRLPCRRLDGSPLPYFSRAIMLPAVALYFAEPTPSGAWAVNWQARRSLSQSSPSEREKPHRRHVRQAYEGGGGGDLTCDAESANIAPGGQVGPLSRFHPKEPPGSLANLRRIAIICANAQAVAPSRKVGEA